MEQVSDTVFRQILARCGRPDVFFTEFTNADGIIKAGLEKMGDRLQFSETERPIIAQIWGLTPEHYYQAARIISGMGFDGIDINMGCPDRAIVKKGCCSSLINNHTLAQEIVVATKEGAGELPISVKTRIGLKQIQTEEWIGFLLSLGLQALTIHGRVASEMSKRAANWDEIGRAVKLRDEMNVDTVIIGNGDVKDKTDGIEKCRTFGTDGVMIGRGMLLNLWVFADRHDISFSEKVNRLIEHLELWDKTWGEEKDFNMLKKFYKMYISGEHNSANLRARLMEFSSASETIAFLKNLH